MRGMGGDRAATRQQITPGTVKRIVPYFRPYRWTIALLTICTALDAAVGVANPLLLRLVIDDGIIPKRVAIVAEIAGIVAALAVLDAGLVIIRRWYAAKVGEGLICDLKSQVFEHVQKQSIAFFTRTPTGALVSRLNADVLEAQQAVVSLISVVLFSFFSLVLVLIAMFELSWLVTVMALIIIPVFLIPARYIGHRVQVYARESMQLNAELASRMNERFNVAGAILMKLYGRPEDEKEQFVAGATRLRDNNVLMSINGQVFFVAATLVASLATALVYGLGGSLVINGTFQIGSLVALAALLTRLYGPINQLSNVQIDVMTALVSFDRVFEVLDLKPLIAERSGAVALSNGISPNSAAPAIDFDHVSFRYPPRKQVSLASLTPTGLPMAEKADVSAEVLHEISFHAPSGQLTALVGPSGAGKTTITQLVARLYDPTAGAVRIGGKDLRDVTLASLQQTVSAVTQDAHMFHDSIRANLEYARPGASEQELIDACRAAQIWDLIASLPDGLDTVVGDRGYRLSGGEKQRVALARLLLKAPSIVVLDEATAHLDSESEAAIQQALKIALHGRTSLVIAHRLSTIRDANQILVIDAGRVIDSGTHEELMARGGLYAELYTTQFARQKVGKQTAFRAPDRAGSLDGEDASAPPPGMRQGFITRRGGPGGGRTGL